MSSSEKQPEGSNASGIPHHPNPLASAPTTIDGQDIYAPPLPPHPNASAQGPSHPVSSGGLFPEQPLEQQKQHQPAAPVENQHTAASYIPPPPPPLAAAGTTQPNIDQHTGVTSSTTIPPIPQQTATNLNFPPPPTEEMADVKHPIHPPPATAADGGAHAEMAGAAGAADAAQQPGKKSWGQRFSNLGQKAVAKMGSPGFLPQPLDKECEKTAQILKAFCKNGVYADPSASDGLPTSTNPDASVTEPGKDGAVVDPTRQKPKGKSLVTIPSSVISRAVGLAIFTTLRAGFQVTGAMGSGLLVARLPDGSWSPPSAIQVLSVGGGFQFGVDIYDCVCVINTKEALSAFMNTRVSIGGDMAVSAGPYGAGGAVEVGSTMNSKDEEERRRRKKEKEVAGATAAQSSRKEDVATAAAGAPPAPADSSLPVPERPGVKQRKSSGSSWKPVFSYVKSRGFYAGVQVDGTVIVERKEANAAFYGAPVRVEQILHGQVPVTQNGQWNAATRVLHDVLKGAEAGVLQKQAAGGAADAPLPEQFAPPPAAAGPSSGPVPVSAAAAAVPAAGSAAPGPSTGAPRYDKAAEARAEARQSQVAPPAYEDAPPAYIDDGAHRPGVGDQKQG
jgi:lipid-binding SYLF domain-containing protein